MLHREVVQSTDGAILMVLRSLAYFEDADLDEDVILIGDHIHWDEVKESIQKEVKLIG